MTRAALIALSLVAPALVSCEASPAGGGLSVGGVPFPSAAPPPRAASCPASGPCLEPAQEPVLVVRGDAPARLVLRGWALGAAGQVEVGGAPAEVLSWSDERVVVVVDGARVGVDGSITISPAGGGTASIATLVAPRVSALPGGLAPGLEVAVGGDGFGAAEGRVFFQQPGVGGDGRPGVVTGWSDTQVRVVVPSESSGPQEVRVGRRITHGGRDLGEWVGAPFLVNAEPGGVRPVITDLDCRGTKDEHCRATGNGWGSGFAVTANGRSVVPVQYSEGSATFDLPAGLAPGVVAIVVTTADGAASDAVEGYLYAWKRFRPGNDFAFEGVAGTVLQGDDRPWAVVHHGFATSLLPHRGHALGEVTCGWGPHGGFGTEYSAVFASQLNVFLFVMAGPELQLTEYGSDFRVASCKAKIGSGQGTDEDIFYQFSMPQGGKGRVAGIATFEATGEVLVLLRDVASGRSHLLRRDPQTHAFAFTAAIEEVGYLVQAGERAYFRTAGGGAIGVHEVSDGGFVALDSPGFTPAMGATFEGVAATGALRVSVDDGEGGARLYEWDPATSAWEDRYGLPAAVASLGGTLADPAGDLVLGALVPDESGHTPLHAFRRGADGGWSPLWEDLAYSDDEVPGSSCRMRVGRGALLHSDAGLPLALFEMGSEDCDAGLASWYGPTTLWLAEVLP